jgi:hypothetical protein
MQYTFDVGSGLPRLVFGDGQQILILDNDEPLPLSISYRTLLLAKATMEIGMQRIEDALAAKQAARNDPMARRLP